MMRIPVGAMFLLSCLSAQAQWAVYDKSVHDELKKINSIKALANASYTELGTTYSAKLESANDRPQDLTLGEGDGKAVLKGIDTKFEDLTDLTPEDKAKFIGTMEDCGSDKNKEISEIYKSCMGLRNLRIQTLKSTQQALRNLYSRRDQINTLVKKSREIPDNELGSGIMQRYHFELQSLATLMQADTDMVRFMMDGYREREKLYQIQQAEAQRGMLARGARMTKDNRKIVSRPLKFFAPPEILYEPKSN